MIDIKAIFSRNAVAARFLPICLNPRYNWIQIKYICLVRNLKIVRYYLVRL